MNETSPSAVSLDVAPFLPAGDSGERASTRVGEKEEEKEKETETEKRKRKKGEAAFTENFREIVEILFCKCCANKGARREKKKKEPARPRVASWKFQKFQPVAFRRVCFPFFGVHPVGSRRIVFLPREKFSGAKGIGISEFCELETQVPRILFETYRSSSPGGLGVGKRGITGGQLLNRRSSVPINIGLSQGPW